MPLRSRSTNSPDFTTCKFYLSHKKRNCRGFAKIPNDFCPEHSVTNQDSTSLKRVVCPVDNKHSVYENKLAQHLKVCNANSPTFKPYYSDKINAGSDSEGEDNFDNIKLNNVDTDELKALISLILDIRSKAILEDDNHIYDINQNVDSTISESKSSMYSMKSDKHTFQYANLIEHMNNMDLLNLPTNDEVFLEFGAGKGGFSHFIENHISHKSATPLNELTFILIDRQGVRNRFDAKHKSGPKFERILMDISHLNLNKVDSVKSRRLFVISKHLCGTATDLTLRCLKNWMDKECLTKENLKERLRGIVIALCCHHKCNWKSYVNKSWIRQIGLNPRQFHLLTLLSGWATCGNTKNIDIDLGELSTDANSAIGRKEIGLLCKRILDLGRKYFIQKEFGMANVHLKPYIDQSVTLENCALFVY